MRGPDSANGNLDLKVRGLSRAGLVLTSKPIDLPWRRSLTMRRPACGLLRRARARLSAAPRRGSRRSARGPLAAELMNAPLFAQLRYSGPADTLWRLTGSEILDLSGPFAVGADISGTLANPVTRGMLRTQNARLESPVTGMVIDQLSTDARFSGSATDLQQDQRPTAERAGRLRATGPSPSLAARPCSTSASRPAMRCSSIATTLPRESPGRSASAPTPMAAPFPAS